MASQLVAISVKQPWAALLAAGVKTIEIRTWRTRRLGPVLIHASKRPDERPIAWKKITTPELTELASLRGGFIGIGDIVDCRCYESLSAFAVDSESHHNEPDWFAPPRLYGFVFRNLRVIPYHPFIGQTMFFGVEGYAPPESTKDHDKAEGSDERHQKLTPARQCTERG